MNNKITSTLVAVVAACLYAQGASASYIECGIGRTAALGDAQSCSVSNGGNAHASDLAAAFGGDWTNIGEASDEGVSGAFFDVDITAGTGWGQPYIAGTWSIDATFWTLYDRAVISMHVGSSMAPVTDQWLWEITQDVTAGDWEYLSNNFRGGGMSNLHLWGSRQMTRVAEPASLALLGLGLLGFALRSRYRRT